MNRSTLRLFLALFVSVALAACSTPGFDNRDAGDAGSDTTSTMEAGDVVRADVADHTDASTLDTFDVVDVSMTTDAHDAVDAHSGCRMDSDCASGRVCCPATGACYDPSCTTCCGTVPDAGSDAGIRCAYNTDCPAGEYCAGEGCGGVVGMCAPIPDSCPGVVDPVCGCDGIDYVNPCLAAAASTRVAYPGMCPSGDAGPGDCVDNSTCGAGEFCSGLGCSSPGTCIPRPTACDGVLDPVCACDGHTYANDCLANIAGIRVIARGTCAGDDAGFGDGGRTTDCVDNSTCGRGQFCDGPSCGAGGMCVARPDLCPDVYDPVCGCNGLTYSNACEAHAAGTRVGSSGTCS